MKIKKSANIQGIDLRLRPALIAAEKVWYEYGHELVITSGLDSTHSAGSLHYYGLAIDCRTRYFQKNKHRLIARDLKQLLADNFDVVLHNDHIHIEYDPFKNFKRR